MGVLLSAQLASLYWAPGSILRVLRIRAGLRARESVRPDCLKLPLQSLQILHGLLRLRVGEGRVSGPVTAQDRGSIYLCLFGGSQGHVREAQRRTAKALDRKDGLARVS